MALTTSSVQASRSFATEAGASLGQTGVGRKSDIISRCTYAVSVRFTELAWPPIQPSDQNDPLAASDRLGHVLKRSTTLATALSGTGLFAYREMSPKEWVDVSGAVV